MAGKFEVYKDKKGEFRFRLKAANGEIIATGESYTIAKQLGVWKSIYKLEREAGFRLRNYTDIISVIVFLLSQVL